MCEAAKEIQIQWKQDYGDFFADEKERIKCWISKDPDHRKVKKGFGICVEEGVIHLSKYSWLPRQNQLIEMAQIPGRRYENVTQDFFNWTKNPYEALCDTPAKLFPSMEQIWLAFVMQQKFNKQWDGSKWVKRTLSA